MSTGFYIDINCDMGEGGAFDSDLMPLISSCNIACGGHAGNDRAIEQTIKLALTHRVQIGAHPGYPDKENFGRKPFPMSLVQLKASFVQQVEKVRKEVQRQGGELHHIKPHGALYNELKTDKQKAALIIEGIKEIDSELILFVPPDSSIKHLAENRLHIKVEGFADRTYEKDFSLTARSSSYAVLSDNETILKQVLDMVLSQHVISRNGSILHQKFDTICVHSDTPDSVAILRYLNEQLPQNNVQIEG